MVEFKVVDHWLRSIKIVEIWIDGQFCAALYPQEPNAVRLISNHLAADPEPECDLPNAWRFVFRNL